MKIFGSAARWAADLPAPSAELPARTLLTTVDTAVHLAAGDWPGPVHLNCQFREPLTPVEAPWDRRCLEGLQRWEAGDQPFTSVAQLQPPPPLALRGGALGIGGTAAAAAGGFGGSIHGASAGSGFGGAAALLPPATLTLLPGAGGREAAALGAILGASRGLIVVGELAQPEDIVAAAQLGRLLGWPLAADILSGLRAGVQQQQQQQAGDDLNLVHHLDHLLLSRQHWPALRPDVVLQLGGRLTSKRLCQFLEWASLDGLEGLPPTPAAGSAGGAAAGAGAAPTPTPLQWVFVGRGSQRHDQFHLLTHRLQAPLPLLACALAEAGSSHSHSAGGSSSGAAAQQRQRRQQQAAYAALLRLLDSEASAAIDAALNEIQDINEPEVGLVVSRDGEAGNNQAFAAGLVVVTERLLRAVCSAGRRVGQPPTGQHTIPAARASAARCACCRPQLAPPAAPPCPRWPGPSPERFPPARRSLWATACPSGIWTCMPALPPLRHTHHPQRAPTAPPTAPFGSRPLQLLPGPEWAPHPSGRLRCPPASVPRWQPIAAPAASTACCPQQRALPTASAAAAPWWWGTSPSSTTLTASTCCAAVSGATAASTGTLSGAAVGQGLRPGCLLACLPAGPG